MEMTAVEIFAFPSPYTAQMDAPEKTKVLMCFNRTRHTDVWHILFRIPPRPKPLPRELSFTNPEKIRNLYERFGMKRQLEDVQAFEYAIVSGGGIVELLLGPEQLGKLQSQTAAGSSR